ncbi:MAG: hypothetical protein ACKO91_17640 [Acidimicrobiales bacterium]
MSTTEDPLVYARTILGHARYRAELLGHAEIVAQLDPACRLLDDPSSSFAVILRGLCDAGKTVLANALAGVPVIPERIDVPTPCRIQLGGGNPTVTLRRPDGTAAPFELGRLVADDDTAPDPSAVVEVAVSPWPLPAGITVVDTPSDGLDPRTAVGIDREFGGVLLVTDAAQELGEAELELAAALHRESALLGIVQTKVDLHAHVERILAANRGHLDRAGIAVPVFPVSARLALLGHGNADGTLVSESGTLPLAAALEQLAAHGSGAPRARRATVLARECATFLLGQVRDAQAGLADREAERRTHERLTAASVAVERLRTGQVRWRERLHEGIERLQLDVEHEFRTGLTEINTAATDELDRSDPAKVWEALSERIQRDADELLLRVRTRIATDATTLGQEIAAMFGEELAAPAAAGPLAGPAGSGIERSVTMTADRGAVTVAAVRGALPGSSLFTILAAHLGGVGGALGVVAAGAVALPVGLVFGAVSYRMAQRSRAEARRRAAHQAIRRFLDGYGPEASKIIRDDLIATRNGLRHHFEDNVLGLQQRVEGELRLAAEHAQLDEAGRRTRWAELDEHRQQLELVTAHAERLLAELAQGVRP